MGCLIHFLYINFVIRFGGETFGNYMVWFCVLESHNFPTSFHFHIILNHFAQTLCCDLIHPLFFWLQLALQTCEDSHWDDKLSALIAFMSSSHRIPNQIGLLTYHFIDYWVFKLCQKTCIHNSGNGEVFWNFLMVGFNSSLISFIVTCSADMWKTHIGMIEGIHQLLLPYPFNIGLINETGLQSICRYQIKLMIYHFESSDWMPEKMKYFDILCC